MYFLMCALSTYQMPLGQAVLSLAQGHVACQVCMWLQASLECTSLDSIFAAREDSPSSKPDSATLHALG